MKKVSFPWVAGKLKTALYLVSTVTGLGLAACSDETESPVIPDESPLAVNVFTQEVSRGLVHGSFLPDAAEIGLSLYTAEGAAYRTGYENIKYTAAGTGDAQTWSTPNIPTLSSIEAKLVAYYPWADGTDYNAVPVETDTQTDYMFSGWVNGLSNANNEAYITMDHALTAVRLSLVNEGFTAGADVTALGVKSEALGTSATLDASTGKLTGIQGVGTEFIMPADFSVMAQATDTEILMVPDVDKTTGVTTLSATINGKKYAANINFTESYKQGYIYTYTLALKNTGLSVVNVSVTPWQEGTQDNGDLGVEDKKYRVKINIDDELFGVTYAHNVVGFVGTIDWGDGTSDTYDKLIAFPSHDYAVKGDFIVTAIGSCEGLMSIPYDENGPIYKDVELNLSKAIQSRVEAEPEPEVISNAFITDIIHIGKDMGIFDMIRAFAGQTKLKEIPAGIFDGLTEATGFDGTFVECTGLTSIPQGLFDKCSNVTSFEGTFNGCTALASIPAGLFDYNTKVTSFSQLFGGCTGLTSIPQGLFDKCTEVTDFEGVFEECTGLTSIPVGLFDKCTKVTSFSSTFGMCTGLTNIPQGLFDNCTEVTSFQGVFQYCSALTNIPAGLFDNNIKVTDAGYIFAWSGITEVPEGLFDKCPDIEYFSGLFTECKNLKSLPVNLFDFNKKAKNFYQAFRDCTALTGESPYTIINVDGTDVKVHLYERSLYPQYFTAPTVSSVCFQNCTALTDYDNIPTIWKKR